VRRVFVDPDDCVDGARVGWTLAFCDWLEPDDAAGTDAALAVVPTGWIAARIQKPANPATVPDASQRLTRPMKAFGSGVDATRSRAMIGSVAALSETEMNPADLPACS
jgi:hypothetical protein